ncbi:MAG TPA: hypothetical protein DCS19_11310 [Flavobacterium sp.]|nr:hypothetical protein [Flavobacterium sp.]
MPVIKPKFQVIEFTVPTGTTSVTKEDNVKDYLDNVTGVFFMLSNENAIAGSTVRLEIAKEEILPENFDIGLVIPKAGVAAKDYPLQIREIGKNSTIRIDFKCLAFGSDFKVKLFLSAEQIKNA